MKDVHLNDAVQYLLLLILMLSNNYKLSQVERHLDIKKVNDRIFEENSQVSQPLFNRYLDCDKSRRLYVALVKSLIQGNIR